MQEVNQNKRHGLSIGLERVESEFYLSLSVTGKLTHKDYEVITPMLDAALEGVKEPHINALLDMREMDDWELGAAWDDFKLGLKHGSEFSKIAICGNKGWQELAAKVGSWFIGGEARYFEEYDEALAWVYT